ncbi:ectoine/hydroxyectoine ABC transporter permease subunit EhuC [Bradyrhizobium sp. NBAIM01]|uniref:ectoine/hydroxyectoine ABC transporter permease subunit EhuC n=1 Tax=Bradyrhizobium sp. NBAIM01 TaxID=2793818 RepID=UPI001CD4957B|nr:ectoine/hydroxyectoine ABC transporter permease subunit EhuC [Bradyrhizobium sp. NBAIM01]MCA1510400.1 ectoine/hydroxyectoine ABC transporter permease subunit EhuC [Bradyrhizobium sp. NBAIM01]
MEVMTFLPILLKGVVVTIQITAAASVVAIVLAFVAGLARLSSNRAIRWLAVGYVELFRGTSLLLQLFWMFFVLPNFGLRLDPFPVAVLVLGLNIGAYGSEIVRGAIVAVPASQVEAAIALNMSASLRMRRIIVPQALVTMLLPWGNLLIILLKSTALVSLITLQDLTFQAYNLNVLTFRTWELYSLTLVMYFVMAQAIALAVAFLYRRLSSGMIRGWM